MRVQAGVTLIELVIVLVAIATLAAFLYPVLVHALNAYDASSAAFHAATKGRYALERAAREMREVRRNPADASRYDIGTMTATQFAFTRTDGVTVTLACSGANFSAQYSSPPLTATLSDQLTGCGFAYFQQNGASAATGPADVRFVEASLVLVQGSGTYSNRVRVALRNPQ